MISIDQIREVVRDEVGAVSKFDVYNYPTSLSTSMVCQILNCDRDLIHQFISAGVLTDLKTHKQPRFNRDSVFNVFRDREIKIQSGKNVPVFFGPNKGGK